MRIHITTDDVDNRSYGPWFVSYFAERAAECRFHVHQLVPRPDDADAILILARGDEYSSEIRRHPLVRSCYEKVFVYDVKDRPIPFLPGLYSSLPRRWFNPDRHAAAQYLAPINPAVAKVAAGLLPEAELFFSFIGAANSPVRRRLFRSARNWVPCSDVMIETSPGWAKRGSEEVERRFAETIARSRFVLCPRGIGTSSFRLFETMELGRVPVILSNAWVPPRGPDWERFSLRFDERRVSELPALLAAREGQATEMGRAARAAWLEWFAPDVQFHRVAEAVHGLLSGGKAHPAWLPWTWRTRAVAARVGRGVDRWVRRAAKGGLSFVRRRPGSSSP